MKTNHRREGDKPRKDSERYAFSPMGCKSTFSPLALCGFGGCYGGDNANGHQGYARKVAGAKKYGHSRTRFHEKANLKKMAAGLEPAQPGFIDG